MIHRLRRHPAGGETTLYLVRHGRTAGNAKRLLHGSTDLPLDSIGIRQAERIAERLARSVRADALVSSPLIRARSTAEIIGQRLRMTPEVIPGLAEMNFGDLEGASLETLARDYPELARRALDVNDDDLTWPNGESRREFHTRVRETFVGMLTAFASHTVVVVAHGGVLGSLLAQIEGRSPNDWRAYQLLNCSLTHVAVRPDRTIVHYLNDTLHLEALAESEGGSGDR